MQLAPTNYIEIQDGMAVISGTGIKVAYIAPMYVHDHTPIEWIAENYDLTPAQIHAALSYYYDHADELEQYLRDGNELARRVGVSSDEVLETMRQRLKKKQHDESAT